MLPNKTTREGRDELGFKKFKQDMCRFLKTVRDMWIQKIVQSSKQEYIWYERENRIQTTYKNHNFQSDSVPPAPTSTLQDLLENFTIIYPRLQSDSFSKLTI